MYTLTALLFFIAFYLFYRTSSAVRLPGLTVKQQQLVSSSRNVKWAAGVCFLVGWVLLVIAMGWGAGTFAVLAYTMCAGSLVVLIAPLRIIRGRSLLFLIALSLLLEFFIR